MPRVGPAPPPARHQLANGLTVVLQPHAGAAVAAVQIWMRVGGRDEGPTEAGLSHFIEHLLFKGTPTRGPGVIDETIAALGGEMNAATSHDWTYFHVVLPAAHLDTALDVLADAARHAILDPTEVERERLVVLEEIRRAEDNPSSVLWRLLSRAHFDGHPYGRPVLGSAESIRDVAQAVIVDYFTRHYTPANATVVVAGPFEEPAGLAAVSRAFGSWEGPPACVRSGDPAVAPATPLRLEETRPLHQTYVSAAWSGPLWPDPDVYALDVLTSVLGQGRASRLTQALRERQGLVSGVGARFYLQQAAGTIVVTARTTVAPYPAIEAAVLAELERLAVELVDARELARAVTAVEADHAFGRETAEGAGYALGLAETVWTLEFELAYLERIRGVTREAVREAARRHLSPARFTGVVLGPGTTP